MGILKSIGSLFRRKSIGSDELSRFYEWLGVDDVQSSTISEATYFTCLKLCGEAVGKLPLKLMSFEDRSGVSARREDPRYYTLGTRPNPYQTATTFWSTVEINRLHYGNAYVLIKGAGRNMSLWILPPERVQVVNDDKDLFNRGTGKLYYVYSGTQEVFTFDSEEILHFRTSTTFDGIIGLSIREQLKTLINGGIDAQNMLNRMYKSGYNGKAVLQYTGDLNDELVQTYIRGIEAYASGKNKKDPSTIIPIPVGSTLTPLNMKLSDGQFLEIKQYTALQIAAAFGIKPNQINDLTKSSYSSGEQQQLAFYVDTMLYVLKQYEEELSYKLLSARDINKGLFFKFNIDVVLRADFATRVDTLSKAANTFLMSPNECRERLDLGSVEHGDILLGQGANIRIDQVGAQYNANAQLPEEDPEKGDNLENGRD